MTDEDPMGAVQSKPKRVLNLPWIIEAFSVFTAAAFVVSGFGNALAFCLAWRLNYFMIASPSDVVMSGFIVITTALFILSLAVVLLVILASVLGIFMGIADLVKYRLRGRNNIEMSVKIFGLYIRIDGIFDRMFSINAVLSVSFIIGLVGLIFSAGSILLTQKTTGASPIQSGWLEVFSSKPDIRAVGFNYRTGLQLTASSELKLGCESGLVLWMGSTAAIVRCSNQTRVFHKLDEFVTEPVPRH